MNGGRPSYATPCAPSSNARPTAPPGVLAHPERVLRAVAGAATRKEQKRGARKSPLTGKRAPGDVRQGQGLAGNTPTPRIRWVVDTGASRHIVPPQAAGSHVRPTDVKVETANGVVPAAGIATVPAPELGRSVNAPVLQQSPCLLSAGALVRGGYTIS